MTGYDLSAWPLFRSVIDESRDQRAKPRRCFVVGPFDDASNDVRRHAEAVWKYIVRPALLDTEYDPRRIEADQTGGVLTQPLIDGLLDDDLIISVLSFSNPNVYYQTALAHAAARPMVLMIEEGQPVSLDPRGAPLVPYSLDTDSVFSAINVKRLQAAVRHVLETPPAEQPFRSGGAALNAGGNGAASMHERSQLFSYERRLAMVREATSRIDMMGIANLALALHPDTAEVFRSRSGSGVDIRILQCAPTNPNLTALIGTRDVQHLSNVRTEIEAAADAWRRISDIPDLDLSITVRRTQTSIPLASALITDKAVIATPYLASRVTAECPAWHAAAGYACHAVMCQEFDHLWSEAVTLFRAERRPSSRSLGPNGVPVRNAPTQAPAAQPAPVVERIEPAPARGASPSGGGGGGRLRGFSAIRGLGSNNTDR